MLERRYHVPRSQVWQGSGGRQMGNIHYHTTEPISVGRIHRDAGQALCGKSGWYEREPDATDSGHCPKCLEIAGRLIGTQVAATMLESDGR